jgi:glycosyltransferase involved in cell wall biosynthesis
MATIVHLIIGLQTGGAELMLTRLVAHTDRARFRPVVVSMTDSGSLGPVIERAGVECVALGLRRGIPDPIGLWRLDRVLRRAQPDILQTWLYHADMLGLIVRQLMPVRHLLWNLRCSDMRLPPLNAALRRVLARFSAVPDAVIVNSQAGKRFHERIGYRPRRWEYVPNGFDTEALTPDPQARRRLRCELGVAEDAVVIGLPARYHPMKDHTTFFAAARILALARPEARFLLVGAGTERSNPVHARSGIADRLLPLGERGDMAAVYAALDIATLTSASGEGFPNVLGEAMACGVPCVATDIGDAAIVLGEAGLVVPPRDPEALAAAWERLIAAGPQARRELGLTARAHIVRDHALEAVVGRYQALYDDILAQGAPQATPAGAHRLLQRAGH